MKKLVVLGALLVSALGFSQEVKIRTERIKHTQITIHNRLYAEGNFEQNKTTFFFKCQQFQGISIIKPIELTPHDTEKLYNALTDVKGKKGQIVDFPTLDNKLIHIEYKRYMFKTYAIFDIVDKGNDAIYHIFCLPKAQLDRLFDKSEIDFIK